MTAAIDKLQQLDEDELDALIELAQARANSSMTKRDFLKAAGVLGTGAVLGGGAASELTGDAQAAASTTDGDGDIGTPANPEDVYADALAVFDGANNQIGSFDETGIETPSVDTDRSQTAGVPVYDVTHSDYGAVGDGATDDTTAIQAAIDDADGSGGGNGGVVYLPPGDYLVTSELTVSEENIIITGSQMQATRITANFGSAAPVIHVNGTSSDARKRVIISDLEIIGDDTNTTYAIRASHIVRYCRIENVFVNKGTSAGMYLSDADAVVLDGCGFGGGNQPYGARVDGNAVSLRDCYAINGADGDNDYGFRLDDPDAARVVGCVAENVGNGIEVRGNSIGGVHISGWSSESLTASTPKHIHVGADTNQTTTGVHISGQLSAAGAGYGLYVDNADGVIVTGFDYAGGDIYMTPNAQNVMAINGRQYGLAGATTDTFVDIVGSTMRLGTSGSSIEYNPTNGDVEIYADDGSQQL